MHAKFRAAVALLTATTATAFAQPVSGQTPAPDERWLTSSAGCYHDVVPSPTRVAESLILPKSLLTHAAAYPRASGALRRVFVLYNQDQEIAAGKIVRGRDGIDYIVSRKVEDPTSIIAPAKTSEDLARISTTHGLHIGSTRTDLVAVMGPSAPSAVGCESWLYAYAFKRAHTCETISFIVRNPGRKKALYAIEEIKYSASPC
jgi:hypothetical protein